MSGQLSARDTLKTAWKNVSGSKGAVWMGMLWMMLINFAVLMPVMLIIAIASLWGLDPHSPFVVFVRQLLNLIALFVITPIVAAMCMLGVKRARGEAINLSSSFSYYKQWKSFVGVKILSMLLLGVFILPIVALGATFLHASLGLVGAIVCSLAMSAAVMGFVAMIVYLMFALQAVADQKLRAVDALRYSYHLVKSRWFYVFRSWVCLLLILASPFIVAAILIATHITAVMSVGIVMLIAAIVLFFIFGPTYSVLVTGELYTRLQK